MLKFILALIIYFTVIGGSIFAQDTLPGISVKNRGGKTIISWKNTYGANISNINIQRSVDSLKRFTTIGTVLNPLNKENGFVDSRSAGGKIFYRVFIAFEGGSYLFSRSYRPVTDTSTEDLIEMGGENKEISRPGSPAGFVASKFVFTGKDNNVIINIPNAASEKYSIKFFDESDNPIFELFIKEPYLILEKVNFLHAGLFKYHLSNNGILLEKYKFYIPKDGRSNTNGKEPRNK